MARVAVALGSNLGDRLRHIEQAVAALEDVGDVVALSSVYETAPVGGPEQGPYLNAVAILQTALDPQHVLDRLLDIERSMGRERREPWGPRTIDLDLVLHGASVVDQPGLTVPHPRMTERRFVLEPLLEVWPDARLPDGTPVAVYRDAVAGQAVHRYDASTAEEVTEPDEVEFRPLVALAVVVIFSIGAAAVWQLLNWAL